MHKIKKNLDAQIIYVDDNSKDNGYSILKKRIHKEDGILLLKSKKNLGPGNARNIGLRKARGKKIIFLEINTQPGLTPVSLVPEQLNYKGIDFSELIHSLINLAECRK